jgi:hypothetical protein
LISTWGFGKRAVKGGSAHRERLGDLFHAEIGAFSELPRGLERAWGDRAWPAAFAPAGAGGSETGAYTA